MESLFPEETENAEDSDYSDDELPRIEEIKAPSSLPPRSGSPEPPRDFVDDLLDDLGAEVEEEFDDFEPRLEGLEKSSDGTGFYLWNKRSPTMPNDVDVELVSIEKEIFKSCVVSNDQMAGAINALMAPGYFEKDVEANPPTGSWHLYVDLFAFLDDERRAEYRFDCVPGDGLSTNATRARFTRDAIHVTCQLLDHQAGPRSWTFACRTHARILPEHCSVKVYPSLKKVRVFVVKATPEKWQHPGSLYAPLTKNNYRSMKDQMPKRPPTLEDDLHKFPDFN